MAKKNSKKFSIGTNLQKKEYTSIIQRATEIDLCHTDRPSKRKRQEIRGHQKTCGSRQDQIEELREPRNIPKKEIKFTSYNESLDVTLLLTMTIHINIGYNQGNP